MEPQSTGLFILLLAVFCALLACVATTTGQVGVPYSASFTASGGTGGYTYALATGTSATQLTQIPGPRVAGEEFRGCRAEPLGSAVDREQLRRDAERQADAAALAELRLRQLG